MPAQKILAGRLSRDEMHARMFKATVYEIFRLDVEGIPDRDFYYLIGLRIKSGDTYVQYAFWANALSEEQAIWAAFLQTLATIDHPQLIHYGSYETTFLKRMKERYRAAVEQPAFLDQLIAESVN